MNQLTDEVIENYFVKLSRGLVSQYGSHSLVPAGEIGKVGEMVRGLYVLQLWQSRGQQGSAIRFLTDYSVSKEAAEVIVPEFIDKKLLAEITSDPKPIRRVDKWKTLEDWAKNNTYSEVSTEQLVEISGFSYQTVLNYAKTSPYFRKIQRGQWEVRDPKQDREHEKNL